MTVNRRQLAKILELLGSAHDGEALAAARRADAMVKAADADWASLLGVGAIAVASPPAASPTAQPNQYQPPRRRGREVTSFEMLIALLKSERTPAEIKKRLRPLERALLDGDVGEGEIAELRLLFGRYVAIASAF